MNRSHPTQVPVAGESPCEGNTAPSTHVPHPPPHMRRRAYSQLWIAPELGDTSPADAATEE
jgi:hypothetical protein